MNADFIRNALKVRHPANEWIYVCELRTRRGYSTIYHPSRRSRKSFAAIADIPVPEANLDGERYIDAFAMNLFPSKAHRRVAYEVKVNRQDWLNEIANPCKRAQAFYLSHEFWFALAPGVYDARKDSMLTDGCGILEIQEDGKITTIYPAAKREAWPMLETFIVSLVHHALRTPSPYEGHDSEIGQEDSPIQCKDAGPTLFDNMMLVTDNSRE